MASIQASTGQTGSIIEVQVEEGLRALIFQHTIINDTVCWTLLSQGLATYGQKEVVFTIRKVSAQYPQDVLRWYSILLSFAKQQRLVEIYGISEFRSGSFLGHPDVQMILYTPKQVLTGLTPEQKARFPENHLHAVPLTSQECQVYKQEGALRILTNIARVTRYYPFPPWFDPARPTLVYPNNFTGSIMKSISAYRIPGLSAFFNQSSGDITLTVTPRAYDGNGIRAIESAPASSVVGLQLELDDQVQGCLVWQAGQNGPSAVGRGEQDGPVNNLTLGLCNLVFCPQQDSISFKLVEDGYVVLLTDPAWATIRSALTHRSPVSIACTPTGPEPAPSIHIDVMETTFENPVDGKTYIAPGGWKTYRPDPSKAPPATANNNNTNKRVDMGGIVLLTNPSPAECNATHLANWLRTINSAMEAQLATAPEGPPASLALQISIDNGFLTQLELVYANRDYPPSPAEVQALAKLKNVIRPIPIPGTVRFIKFQIEFNMPKGVGEAAFHY
ncbi:hypothetical protein CPB86DRAFT_873255 [Serendipita vermifera]|nr:hypothetical protein CPB86DRAFT_873255 [Serendipita vermifera]